MRKQKNIFLIHTHFLTREENGRANTRRSSGFISRDTIVIELLLYDMT